MSLCKNFINRPINSYRPLVCKPIVVTTRELRGTGLANKLDLFFLLKPNTLREHATVDLLYPAPDYLKTAVTPKVPLALGTRVTTNGLTRVVDGNLVRVTE